MGKESSKEIVSFRNDPIQSSATYGSTGESWYFPLVYGNYVSRIDIYNDPPTYALSGLGITFDDGTSVKVGGTNKTVSKSIDLSNDTIAKMYVQLVNGPAYGGTGVGNIYIETIRGQKVTSDPNGQTPLSGGRWQLVCASDTGSTLQNFVLVGFEIHAGNAIDALAVKFKDDILVSYAVENFAYTFSDPGIGTPINVASAVVHNQTDTTETMSVTFQKAVSSAFTWSVSEGAKVSLSTSFKTGIPVIAEGKVTLSAEVSFNATQGKTHTTTDTFSYTSTLSVPAKTKIIANATAFTGSVNGTYKATYIENWAHAGLINKPINGVINGVAAYNVEVDYTTVS